MTRHRTIEPALPQPVKTKRSSHGLNNGRTSVKVESTTTNGVNTPSKPFDPPKTKPKAKNTPSEPLESIQTSDHDSVGVLSSNRNTSKLEAIRATTKAYLASLPQSESESASESDSDSNSESDSEKEWTADYAREHYAQQLALFVQDAYPWKKEGSPLEPYDGPDIWQKEALLDIENGYCHSDQSFWYAIASGRGVGKTALLSWLIQWFICTRINPLIIVTASTKEQLSIVTWRELQLWHMMSPLTKTFELLKTQYRHKKYSDTWFARPIAWQANRPEAFQGLHDKEMLIIMDEASIIDPIIWEAVQGNFSRGNGLWVVCSNPLWNTSRFRQCFPGGRFAHRWHYKRVDSRKARMADKEEWQKWIDDYGPDSDEAKKYVYGEFPETEEGQYIGGDIIQEALKREPIYDPEAEYIIGIDLARSTTGDASVLLVRHGSKIVHKRIFRERNGTIIRDKLLADIELFKDKKPRIYVDSVSGWGIMKDMLEEKLKSTGISINEVQSGGRADSYHYDSKRVEMWVRMKKWLETKGCLEVKEENLIQELTQVRFTYSNDALVLESKKEMKSRGLSSTDEADALAFTFAEERRTLKTSDNGTNNIVLSGNWRQTFAG